MTERLEGWKVLAAAIGRSERWCREQSHRTADPLPIFYVARAPDAIRGRPCVYLDELVAWMRRNSLPALAVVVRGSSSPEG